MARRDFFAHVNPDGRRAVDRIRATGYPREATVGENLAWGEESDATPVRIVEGWMNSPGHRANVLRHGYREIGVGITVGSPQPKDRRRAVTYVTTFGGR